MSTQHHGTVCITCRRRGKKCNKELPKCSTCTSKGIVCEGYTFRWSGVASRGKLAGKLIPVADGSTSLVKPKATSAKAKAASVVRRQFDTPVPILKRPVESTERAQDTENAVKILARNEVGTQKLVRMNTTDGVSLGTSGFPGPEIIEMNFDTIRNMVPESTMRRYSESDIVAIPSINPMQGWRPTRPLDTYNIPTEIRHVVDYFLAEVSPRLCVDMSAYSNPYSQYILPLAFRTPSLLYACAALAACQVNIRLGDREHLMKALRFKGKSMKRLQESLYSDERAKDPGTVATILMLSLCDLSLGGSASFDAHFLGAKRLIDMRGSQKSPGNFVEQYIAWLDTMAATSSARKPIFSAADIAEWTSSSKDPGSKGWSYDVFPCPVDQFQIINEIVELYKSQTDPSKPTAEVLVKVRDCKVRILGLPAHTERDEYWLHLTEAYRFAIVLYLLRLFNTDIDDSEISWLTDCVFHHANSTEPLTGWADQMLWPLFHAALEVRDDKRKQWTRDRAKEMLQSGGFRNVENALEILERVWAGNAPPDYMSLFSGDGNGCLLFV